MNKKLERDTRAGALAGVCAGLANYLAIDKTWIRLAFVLSVVFSSFLNLGFLGPLLYIILWIVLPVRERFMPPVGPFDVDYRMHNESAEPSEPIPTHLQEPKRDNSDRKTAGLILLVIGVFFLLAQTNLFAWRDLIQFWPVVLIISGLVMIFQSFNRRVDDDPGL